MKLEESIKIRVSIDCKNGENPRDVEKYIRKRYKYEGHISWIDTFPWMNQKGFTTLCAEIPLQKLVSEVSLP